ncbi:MAG TPA: Holliday junction resolvase RuvX [Candidatus Limnocylindria bacterium]|nr:Holliday junction resolvase RuvX [Candidatus Limnocylindria bacterium]
MSGRILALDHGSRRIGVAIGDPETGMAFARAAITRRSLDHDLARIGELCTEEGVERVVIGLPLHADGSEGEQAASARAFGQRLAAATGLEVEYEDERLTSWAAGEGFAAEGRRPDRGSGELDSAAARLILQQYFDARRQPGDRARPAATLEETDAE